MSDPITKIFESWADTESSRAVNYMGFGLKLATAMELAQDLNLAPCQWLDDPSRRSEDLDELAKSLKELYVEYLKNKNQWGKK